MICTNDVTFFNYLQNKGVKVVLYENPIEIHGVLNIFFPETHNITICGNRYNNARIESGEMKKELQRLHDLIQCKYTIVITPVTLFNGELHNKVYPDSVLDVKRQRIHTSKLGELVYPHFVHIYGAELKPTTNIEPLRDYVFMAITNSKKHYILMCSTISVQKRSDVKSVVFPSMLYIVRCIDKL